MGTRRGREVPSDTIQRSTSAISSSLVESIDPTVPTRVTQLLSLAMPRTDNKRRGVRYKSSTSQDSSTFLDIFLIQFI
jgi:hypothetical protein